MKTNAAALPAVRTKTSDYVMLAKPRLNGLVVASALAGYAMAGGDTSDVVRVCGDRIDRNARGESVSLR